MADTIVVIAAGEMGAGIGKRLTERGARVLTSLQGRGAGSAARAKQAGMIDVEDDQRTRRAGGFHSVGRAAGPGRCAGGTAEAGAARRATRNPIYVDCNAVAPKTR